MDLQGTLDLPEELLQETINVASLKKALAELQTVRKIHTDSIERLRRGRTRVDFLLAAAKHREGQKAIHSAKADLELVEKAIAMAQQILTNVEKDFQNRLEDHLRATSPEYRQYLLAEHTDRDADLSMANFREKVKALYSAIGEARNTMTAGYNLATARHSDYTLAAMDKALHVARGLEESIQFFNQLGESHDRLMKEAAIAGVTFPRLPAFPYAVWLESQLSLPIGAAQYNIDRMMKELDKLSGLGLLELQTALSATAVKRREAADGFIKQLSSHLQEVATTLWVTPEIQEQTIERLEKMALQSPSPERPS